MDDTDGLGVAMLVLRLATQVVEGIQDGLAERGFADVRPAHGFAFVRISTGDATVLDVAEHLGVTKQAASQLVEQLVRRGYLTRDRDPRDGRARLLTLTERGRECTRAAEEAAAAAAGEWREHLGPGGLATLHRMLRAVAVPGRLRPAW